MSKALRPSLLVTILSVAALFGVACTSNDPAPVVGDGGRDASVVDEGDANAIGANVPSIDRKPEPANSASDAAPKPSSGGTVVDSGNTPDDGSLLGVDLNDDGVRDDIERLIQERHPDSERTRAALDQLARAMQSVLRDAGDAEKTLSNRRSLDEATWCATAVLGTSSRALAIWLHDETYNTLDRALAYFTAQSHLGAIAIPPDDGISACAFDPSTMAD